jgi:hypothetical protein
LKGVLFELLVLMACPVFGPFFTFKASYELAIEAWNNESYKAYLDLKAKRGTPEEQTAQLRFKKTNVREKDHTMTNKVIVFVEGMFESLPQLAIQATAFYLTTHSSQDGGSDLDYQVFFVSVSFSLLGVLKATLVYAYYREEILKILGPPPKTTLKGTGKAVMAARAFGTSGDYEWKQPPIQLKCGVCDEVIVDRMQCYKLGQGTQAHITEELFFNEDPKANTVPFHHIGVNCVNDCHSRENLFLLAKGGVSEIDTQGWAWGAACGKGLVHIVRL